MLIYVIHAVNSCDFDDDDAWAAGLSKDLAEEQLTVVLKARWDGMDDEQKEFYDHYFNNYETSFNGDMTCLEPRES